MKLTFALIAVVFTSFAATPAFADWDMPDANAVGSTIASNVANMTSQPTIATAYSEASGLASSGFDLSSLGSTASDETSSAATEKGTTGTQTVSTLPLARTHTLSVISGPVKANGLPACTLDSFVYMALTNIGPDKTDAIYGDEGAFGRPKLTDFQPINSGIAGPSAAGLTTGQAH